MNHPDFTLLRRQVDEAITARDVVNVSGDFRVAQGDAGETLLKGIAMQSATALNDLIDVDFGVGVVYDLVASGAVPAGTAVESAATGAVSAVAGDCDPHLILGYALAAAADNSVPVVIR